MEFNTRLLHGKAVRKYPDSAILPPISQVTAFRFDTAEEQAQCEWKPGQN